MSRTVAFSFVCGCVLTAPAVGVNWADKITAISTLVATALFLVALIVSVAAGLIARNQLAEAKRDRHVQIIADMMRRWSDPLLEESRVAVQGLDDVALEDKLETWINAPEGDRDVEVLLRVPIFFEDLALLVESGTLERELVWRAFAGPALQSWQYWERGIGVFQKRDLGAFAEYKALAKELREMSRAKGASTYEPLEKDAPDPATASADEADGSEEEERESP